MKNGEQNHTKITLKPHSIASDHLLTPVQSVPYQPSHYRQLCGEGYNSHRVKY